MKHGSPTRLSHFSHTLSHFDFSVFLKCPSNFPIMVFVFPNTCGFVEFSTWRALYWCHNSARWFSPAAWPRPFTAIGWCFVCLLFFSFNALSYQSLPRALHALSFSQRFCAAVSLSKCALPTLGLGWLRLALLNIVGGSKRKREPCHFLTKLLHFLCTDLYIIFVPPSNFFFFFIPRCFQPPPLPLPSPLLTPLWLVGPFSPAILSPRLPAHPFMLCAWTKTNVPPRTDLPQLTALTHAPWPPHHSTGNHPPLWMICSSPLYLDSSLFLSYAACSSLLLKMVTPQSLFTLFGMLLLAIYLFFVYLLLI